MAGVPRVMAVPISVVAAFIPSGVIKSIERTKGKIISSWAIVSG
jgi:hypothetical protein